MIVPQRVNSRFQLIQPYFEPLQKTIRETLAAFCEKNGYALVYRPKSVESTCEKIESGRFSTWDEIDDLVAFAIVIPTLKEEEQVVSFLQNQFIPVRLKTRGSTMKPPDTFRFDSTRFSGRLRTPPGQATRPIDAITFEIQVRSAFDHAWIVTTHALAYKSNQLDWKQQRLAAELKATTEKMDMLILAFDEAAVKVPASPWPKIEAKKEIHTFFQVAAQEKRFPAELIPKDWSRFIDNIYALGEHCSGKRRPAEIAKALIDAVNLELLSLGPGKVPLSLSLWQISLASLRKAMPLNIPEDYWPLITPELEDLYPILRETAPRFELGGQP